jgi:hypothetical protein
MEVSPTGQGPVGAPLDPNNPATLVPLMISFQGQLLEQMRLLVEMQKQQLELTRETVQMARDQRQRQGNELERWHQAHDGGLEACKMALGQLEQVHASLMREMTGYVDENHDNLLDGDFSLSDFVDRFGPRLAHLNTMLAVLRPLAAGAKKEEGAG